MKRLNALLVPLLLCGAALLVAQTTPTSSIPPSPGLAAFDPTPVVAAFGASSAWNAWADKSITTLGQQVQANSAAIAAIPAGPVGPQGPQGLPGTALPAGTVNFSSGQITASTPAVRLDFASCVPNAPVVGWISAGQTVDFTVPVALAGNYLVNACVSSTGGATYHFEFPVGTKVGASLTAPNTAAWHIYGQQSATVAVALPSGNAVIRVVFESAGMNFGGGSLVKQ